MIKLFFARPRNEGCEQCWEKCSVIIPRRTITGEWTKLLGQVWRRRKNGRWEYRQEAETVDEFWDRIM